MRRDWTRSVFHALYGLMSMDGTALRRGISSHVAAPVAPCASVPLPWGPPPPKLDELLWSAQASASAQVCECASARMGERNGFSSGRVCTRGDILFFSLFLSLSFSLSLALFLSLSLFLCLFLSLSLSLSLSFSLVYVREADAKKLRRCRAIEGKHTDSDRNAGEVGAAIVVHLQARLKALAGEDQLLGDP